MDLAAALRLLEWEKQDLDVHLLTGLPPAEEALQSVLQSLVKSPVEIDDKPSLSQTVYRLWCEHLSWHAALGRDVHMHIDFPDDEETLDMITEFLWCHRTQSTSLNNGTES